MTDDDARFAEAGARGAAMLAAGTPLDEVIRTFYETDRLGAIGTIRALREIAPIDLISGKDLVSSVCEGKRFPHVGLPELRYLARVAGVPDGSTASALRDAVIRGRPWWLLVRNRPGSVHYYTAETEDPALFGSISGPGVSFEAIRDGARRIAAMPAWSEDVRIARDEPDRLLVHFPLVRP